MDARDFLFLFAPRPVLFLPPKPPVTTCGSQPITTTWERGWYRVVISAFNLTA